jgi:hypothetical protein
MVRIGPLLQSLTLLFQCLARYGFISIIIHKQQMESLSYALICAMVRIEANTQNKQIIILQDSQDSLLSLYY